MTDNLIDSVLKRFKKKSLKNNVVKTISYSNGKLKFYSIGITRCHIEDQEVYKPETGEFVALIKARQKAFAKAAKIYEAFSCEMKRFVDYNVESFLYTSEQFQKHANQEELKLYEFINEIDIK